MIQLRTTAFNERTSKLCLPNNWQRWSGFLVAGSYGLTLDREYLAIRDSAALIDVTPLMKYIVKGRAASRLLVSNPQEKKISLWAAQGDRQSAKPC